MSSLQGKQSWKFPQQLLDDGNVSQNQQCKRHAADLQAVQWSVDQQTIDVIIIITNGCE